jgi:putative PEP-CTERM system histidine kinase
MGPDSTFLGTIVYGVGTVAFLFLLLMLADRISRMEGALMAAAVAATAAWLGGSAAHYWGVWTGSLVISALEILRTVGWIIFMVSLLLSGSAHQRTAFRRYYLAPTGILVLGILSAAVILPGDFLVLGAKTPNTVVGLCLAIVGLLLTELLFRHSSAEERWHIKFLCIAAGTIYAYDLFFYVDAALFGRVDPALELARGAVQALTAPLFAIAIGRNRTWQTKIFLSRRMVLGSTTLITSGLYLTLAAIVGYLLREVDETRGAVVQVVFFVGAATVLVIVLSSGAYWAFARNFVGRHFYRHKYDWREEWLRFMRTISSRQSAAPLDERCVKAIADIVDSPGGAMWLLNGDRCERTCEWNFAIPELTDEAACSIARSLGDLDSIPGPEKQLGGPDTKNMIAVPDAVKANKLIWLIVPLWHRSLVGFVALARPRAPRALDWEDFDLLDVVGRQVGSYLSEQRVIEALEEAREFEIFNRRFAFVVHDVKNLVSQLSVLGSNFKKYGHREEFRDDVVSTLNDAADKMRRLMQRIDSLDPGYPSDAAQQLVPLLRRVISSQAEAHIDLVVENDGSGIAVAGDRDRLEALISHLVRNAVEAVKGLGNVTVALRRDGPFAVVDVVDDGPGMHRNFIRRELFKPFQSTKKGGMGLGAHQCREYARHLGGNLEAISAPGRGTTMRVTLPVAQMA